MHILGPGIWGEKTMKNVEIKYTHCRSRNMARKLKNVENEKRTL
jgi:hypothetical protein